MLRLTLATRIALIVIVGLLIGWLVAAALVYRSVTAEHDAVHVSEDRLLALTELIERTPDEQRSVVFRAVSSDGFLVRVDASEIDGSASARLNGRAMNTAPTPEIYKPGLYLRLQRTAREGQEYRIALRTGNTLVVDTTGPLMLTPLGLPVGYGAGLFGTVVALLALIVMQRETKPLARLATVVDGVDFGADPPALPDVRRSAPEIRAVVAAFDRLQRRLAAMIDARMVLMAGIAHDVRTFATRLRLRVDEIPDETERQRAVADIADMTRLLDNALLASRLQIDNAQEELIDLRDVVGEEVEDRRTQGHAVDLTGPAPELVVLVDRLALRRIVTNLVENALRYGRAAHLSLSASGEVAVLLVDDEGSGIPLAARQQMFEPFTRLEPSRNRATGGAGLGLAVVRALVEAADGHVEIADVPAGGARIKVTFPIFRSGQHG